MYTVSLVAEGQRGGLDTDMGLRPGSRVRLVKTAAGVRLGMEVLRPLAAKPAAPTLDQVIINPCGAI